MPNVAAARLLANGVVAEIVTAWRNRGFLAPSTEDSTARTKTFVLPFVAPGSVSAAVEAEQSAEDAKSPPHLYNAAVMEVHFPPGRVVRIERVSTVFPVREPESSTGPGAAAAPPLPGTPAFEAAVAARVLAQEPLDPALFATIEAPKVGLTQEQFGLVAEADPAEQAVLQEILLQGAQGEANQLAQQAALQRAEAERKAAVVRELTAAGHAGRSWAAARPSREELAEAARAASSQSGVHDLDARIAAEAVHSMPRNALVQSTATGAAQPDVETLKVADASGASSRAAPLSPASLFQDVVVHILQQLVRGGFQVETGQGAQILACLRQEAKRTQDFGANAAFTGVERRGAAMGDCGVFPTVKDQNDLDWYLRRLRTDDAERGVAKQFGYYIV